MAEESFSAQLYGESQGYTDIPNKWYKEYNVKEGLRNEDGTRVWIGLTRVADAVRYEEVDGGVKVISGWLLCCGMDTLDLVKGRKGNHFGYGETCFLLLFGCLSKKAELERFCNVARHCYTIPDDFVEMSLLRFLGKNLMDKLQDAVFTLYNYDNDPDNTDIYQTLVKGVNLSARLPFIVCYTYQSKVYYHNRESLLTHYVSPEYSTAESFLSLLRKDQKFMSKEINLLDTILMLHADHGGGNNSTFTNVVIASTSTDIYSAACDGIGSLKGPRHGGANIKVTGMMDVVLAEIDSYDTSDKKIRQSIEKLMAEEFYDRFGLVYGFGHAVCAMSDPHAEVLKAYCMEVAKEQKYTRKLDFYIHSEHIAKGVMEEIKDKALPTSVDFYSGFAYSILRTPKDLYTPLFMCSRVMGWVTHSIKNKLYDDHIMRPATKYIGDNMDYVPMPKR